MFFLMDFLHFEGDSTNNQLLSHAKYVHFIHSNALRYHKINLINITLIKSYRIKQYNK